MLRMLDLRVTFTRKNGSTLVEGFYRGVFPEFGKSVRLKSHLQVAPQKKRCVSVANAFYSKTSTCKFSKETEKFYD
jgi:hypothetical protein